jgi:hypothetical protein
VLLSYIFSDWPPLWSSGQSSWLHNAYVLCYLRGKIWIYMLCRTKYTASVV